MFGILPHTPFHLTGLSIWTGMLTLPIFAFCLLACGDIIPQFSSFVNGYFADGSKGKLFARYKIP